MKKFLSLAFALWVIRYDVYSGGNYVPCNGEEPILVSTSPVKSFQHKLCVSYSLVPKEWPISYKEKSEAQTLADFIKQQGGSINVRVEKKVEEKVEKKVEEREPAEDKVWEQDHLQDQPQDQPVEQGVKEETK